MTDGCFYGNKGLFRVAPPLELKKLEVICSGIVLSAFALLIGFKVF